MEKHGMILIFGSDEAEHDVEREDGSPVPVCPVRVVGG
jgi:hypothetical protein